MSYKRISPQPIVEGGTGAQTFTANGVLLGNTTSAITATTAGSTGQVLTGVTGLPPTFQAPAGSSITITGDTGGGLTGNSFTFTGGTTGLSFGGAGSTETLTFAGITANGGTVSLATDATTSTINIGTGAGVKTSTFGSTNTTSATTLQSGSGALNVTSTNGALTVNSGTGALGISTDASATTVSIATGAAVKAITVGSTNTTSSTIIKSGTGNIALNSGLTVDSTGRTTNTVQPAFLANLSTVQTNVTGNGTAYTIIFDTVNFNQGSNYNNATGTFTAPVTGRYFFSLFVMISNISVIFTTLQLFIQTTANRANVCYTNPGTAFAAGGFFQSGGSMILPMTAGDTATFIAQVSGSTQTANVYSAGAMSNTVPGYTYASAYLVC